MGRKAGLTPDARGLYRRRIGTTEEGEPWTLYPARDRLEAGNANARLDRLWDATKQRGGRDMVEPVWTAQPIRIGRAFAGDSGIILTTGEVVTQITGLAQLDRALAACREATVEEEVDYQEERAKKYLDAAATVAADVGEILAECGRGPRACALRAFM